MGGCGDEAVWKEAQKATWKRCRQRPKLLAAIGRAGERAGRQVSDRGRSRAEPGRTGGNGSLVSDTVKGRPQQGLGTTPTLRVVRGFGVD